MTAALVFTNRTLSGVGPVALVFGGLADGVLIDAVLPGLQLDITIEVPVLAVTFDAALPALVVEISAAYVSGAARPTVGERRTRWQPTGAQPVGITGLHSGAPARPAGRQGAWSVAAALPAPIDITLPNTLDAATNSLAAAFAGARAAAGMSARVPLRSLRPVWRGQASAYRNGGPQRRGLADAWAEMLHDRRANRRNPWQPASGRRREQGDVFAPALVLAIGRGGRYQRARRPPAGWAAVPLPPLPPPAPPCYWPDPHLVFRARWSADAHLVFVCDRRAEAPGGPVAAIVVPVRRVYMVINSATLRRVDGDIPIRAYGLQLAIDAESWTWSCTASLPTTELAKLEPADDETPVMLEATINGNAYRLLVDTMGTERAWGSMPTVSVKARGLSAMLDAPNAPQLNFGNTEDFTAQQLMADVLTDNGVGIGWAVDFGLQDWLVPAGAWSHQGTYISALAQIAAAAGGYLQPHPTEQRMQVLPLYPVAPWEWLSVAPRIELPADVTTRESIEWVYRPKYNRVFVSGVAKGVMGQVTRRGSAGDLVAPMVTDALITHADAARQRGVQVLADTGRQANVTLRLPVLDETGVITPGTFVRYLDGSTRPRTGLVRSTSIEVALPTVWQSIGVQIYA